MSPLIRKVHAILCFSCETWQSLGREMTTKEAETSQQKGKRLSYSRMCFSRAQVFK